MNDNFDTLQAKHLKETLDILLGPGPYDTDYILVTAMGNPLDSAEGEGKAIEVLFIERLLGHSVVLAMGLNSVDTLYSEWEFLTVVSGDMLVSRLPGEESPKLLMWVVTGIAEALAHDLSWLVKMQREGPAGFLEDESVDLALDRWWGITRILADAAEGKLAEFDPYPQHTIEQAQIGFQNQLRWPSKWVKEDVAELLSRKESKELLMSLLQGKNFGKELADSQAKEKPSSVIPQPTNTESITYESKRGLSTNAAAWIVALVIGAFIAIGAALGY